MPFPTAQESHEHSLKILSQFEERYEFLESVGSVCDMGGAPGLDALWWADRYLLDDNDRKIPLDIKTTVVDEGKLDVKHENIKHVKQDFENTKFKPESFDVITSHDSLQYALNPLGTLAHWHDLARSSGMLLLTVQQTSNIVYNQLDISSPDGAYHHFTVPNLIHMLAVSGWDLRHGSFHKNKLDPWITIIAYKHTKRFDPRKTTWRELAEEGILPQTAVTSINKWGHVRQRDLILPWINGHLENFGTH